MLTLLNCGQGQDSRTISALINAFKARVYADTGLYQSQACQTAILEKLNSI
jgi:hypothetical protein